MWNHAATMREEFARRKLPWAELTSQELTDLLVYLRNLPGERGRPAGFEITSGSRGAALFQSKGCVACHVGSLALGSRLKNMTLTDIAVAMWNHEPKMAPNPPHITIDEMRELVSDLWAGQFFEDSGNPAAGARIFASKHCATCHNDASSGAPALPAAGRTFTEATMVSALWHHGPRMLDQMRSKSIEWPHFDAREMSDTIAYLDSKGGGK
jgi:mono/diheme cytochrome c family protein